MRNDGTIEQASCAHYGSKVISEQSLSTVSSGAYYRLVATADTDMYHCQMQAIISNSGQCLLMRSDYLVLAVIGYC